MFLPLIFDAGNMLALPCPPACSYPPKHSCAGSGTWDHLRYLNVSIWCHLRHLGLQLLPQNRGGNVLTPSAHLPAPCGCLGCPAPCRVTPGACFSTCTKQISLREDHQKLVEKTIQDGTFWYWRNSWRAAHHCAWVTSAVYGELWLFLWFTHWSHQVSKSKYAGSSLCVQKESAAENYLCDWLFYEMKWLSSRQLPVF